LLARLSLLESGERPQPRGEYLLALFLSSLSIREKHNALGWGCIFLSCRERIFISHD
jgi:hypothetical protein